MRYKKQACNGAEGRLPTHAPLANPYVPFQAENAPKYEPQKALIRGTLFPGLDLPFMGMVNRKEKRITPMVELQMMAFAIQELALYLDTHKDDAEAFAMYRSYQQMYHKAMKEYVKNYGSINHEMSAEGKYRWQDDPWPWEYSKNKEA